jgi:tetratricopeptide (TPR) repeat protein
LSPASEEIDRDATCTGPARIIQVDSRIEELIKDENWLAARRAIRSKLRSSPHDHWLLTRLGLTYYEQRRYTEALKYALLALNEAPECPLVLWDYAGTLEMMDEPEAALKVYQSLAQRGIQAIAFGNCGEGLARARGLIADCHYRISHCYASLQKPRLAIQALEHHLDLRGPGCRSIYLLKNIAAECQASRRIHRTR